MNLKYLFEFHKWEKFGGLINVGGGKFEQKLICKKCKRIKREEN